MKVFDKAIDFALPDETGKIHKLSDYLGKKVVLYFYPKDLTSGCTEQALEFKRLYEDLKDEFETLCTSFDTNVKQILAKHGLRTIG